jgi:hypothetical protein
LKQKPEKIAVEMIAKIGRSGNLYGALAYNQLKVENENGKFCLPIR